MNSRKFIEALKKSLRVDTDTDLRKKLGITTVTLKNWRDRGTVNTRIVSALMRRLVSQRLVGGTVVDSLARKLKTKSQTDLANKLGITNPAIQIWKKRKAVTSRQIAGLVASARQSIERETHQSAILPLVEFFPIKKIDSRQEAGFSLFSVKDEKGKAHPYFAGLKAELEAHHGVYVFFDSRGQAIYSGKARKQRLWKELNLAFNRERNSLQKIRRVDHPVRRQKYRTTKEKSRQITESSVPLHELAHYFSAYSVVDGMINVVESLLVRSFANDLLNKRMEKFGKNGAT